jgi:drug/metabolite transporter (DMT)-like permease
MQDSLYSEVVKWMAVLVSTLLFVISDGLASNIWEERSVRLTVLVALLGISAYALFAFLCSVLPLAVVSGLVNTGIVAGAILWGFMIKGQSLDWHQKVVVGCALLTVAVAGSRPLFVNANDDIATTAATRLSESVPR